MRRDTEIEQQVLRSLKLTLAMAGREICVESNEGVVTLKGTVRSVQSRSAIHSAASQAPGVRDVVNRLRVDISRLRIPKSRNAAVSKSIPSRSAWSLIGERRVGTR